MTHKFLGQEFILEAVPSSLLLHNTNTQPPLSDTGPW